MIKIMSKRIIVSTFTKSVREVEPVKKRSEAFHQASEPVVAQGANRAPGISSG